MKSAAILVGIGAGPLEQHFGWAYGPYTSEEVAIDYLGKRGWFYDTVRQVWTKDTRVGKVAKVIELLDSDRFDEKE